MANLDPRPEPERPPQGAATPAMAQYFALKAGNPGYLLFYRMGDFYELFFEDAEKAAAALDIALTKRGKHQGADIPMCGVPVHASDGYLERLIAKGFKVAVCEQMEDPAAAKKRGSKAPLQRAVVRLVTPGTLTEESLLEARAFNYLVALSSAGRPSEMGAPQLALGWLDISTGDFGAAPTSVGALAADLARLGPAEILVGERLAEMPEIGGVLALQTASLSVLDHGRFDSLAAERRLKEAFAVGALDGLGNFSRAEIAALGVLLGYAEETQVGRLPAIKPPKVGAVGGVLALDPATRTNLELVAGASGGREGSLLGAIDKTVSSGGARLLAARLGAPSTDVAAIEARLDAVEALVENAGLRERLRERLRRVPDLARALARLSLGRGGPRDLAAVGTSLEAAFEIAAVLGRGQPVSSFDGAERLGELLGTAIALSPAENVLALARELIAALSEDLPLLARDGGFVRAGYDASLDETRALRDESRAVLARLEAKYRERSGVASLKIKHNNVLGYFIEVSATHGQKLLSAPLSELFIHRQTLAGAVRFTTPELSELASRILDAGAQALSRELEIFERLVSRVTDEAAKLHEIADAISVVDVAQGLATLASEADYIRPRIDESRGFEIEAGRHPVVEAAMRARGEGSAFIANSSSISIDDDGAHILLVTGPNMAGKSTYLRQNALIAILAQMGSFVPARAARIGLVDRIFSRVGASDDLARGRSTFMVEMIETAAILNQAGPRALVILDEIGRGTATYDGLAIAWAVLEHLHEVSRPRALFATHYHELTALTERLSGLEPVTMSVKEWNGDIIFLHEVVPGAADRSYGVQVAKLAGVPSAVIERAQSLLEELEREGGAKAVRLRIDDLPLFRAAAPPKPSSSALTDKVLALDPDAMSPREALEMLYLLKAEAQKERTP